MLFTKANFSTLVGIAVLFLAVSAQDTSHDAVKKAGADADPATTSQAGLEKMMAPLNLANANASKDAVKKLVGTDISSGTAKATEEQAHCFMGHASAKIVRIRYDMSMVVDTDEGGTTSTASAEKLQGAVVKATSGLYSHESPDKGSCAKSLARLGESCANRPYVVPATLLKPSADKPADTPTDKPADKKSSPWYHAGPYRQKRDEASNDRPRVVIRPDNLRQSAKPDSGSTQTNAQTPLQSADKPAAVCVDTVKRDATITKVVPSKARKMGDKSGAQMHFELVRTDAEKGAWSQIIYNKRGKVVDVTNVTLTEDMSFWRAEYYCADCPPGHKLHKIFYENVEIEIEKSETSTIPTVQCSGRAASTNVHKKDHSRYQHKNKSTVEYTGTIFSIDRVSLGHFDKNDKGGSQSIAKGEITHVDGSVSASDNKPVDETTVDLKNDGKPPLPDKALLANTAKPDGDKANANPDGDKAKATPDGDKAKATPDGDKAKATPDGDKAKSAVSETDKTLLVNTANPDEHKGNADASASTTKPDEDQSKPAPYTKADGDQSKPAPYTKSDEDKSKAAPYTNPDKAAVVN